MGLGCIIIAVKMVMEKRKENRHRSWLALGLLVPAPTIGVLMAAWWVPGALGQAVWLFCKIWTILWPAFWWLVVEGRKWSWSKPIYGGLGVGALSGVVVGLVIWAAFLLFGETALQAEELREALSESGLDGKLPYLLGALYWTGINSLLEEYIWRWFVFDHCERLLPSRRANLAVFLAAGLFSLHHLVATLKFCPGPVALLATFGVFIGGVIWSWLYRAYRSIWPAYVSHAVIDIAVYAVGWAMLFE